VAWLISFLDFLDDAVENKRKWVYGITGVAVIAAIYGVTLIQTAGNLTADFNKNKQIYKDVKYFERAVGGVVPLDIIIDTKREGGVERLSTLRRIEQLQDSLNAMPELSRSGQYCRLREICKAGCNVWQSGSIRTAITLGAAVVAYVFAPWHEGRIRIGKFYGDGRRTQSTHLPCKWLTLLHQKCVS